MDSTSTDLLSWDGPAIGLLDLDAFFASVEQLDHPDWRGKPVIVGGDADSRGVVSTASYEARTFGVHSAMPSGQAKRLCPQGIWTHGHFDRYRQMSAQVMAILGDETPFVEQVSIDEAFFDITPGRYSKESPLEICQRIQRRVSELGITCSIGLGTSKSVAKIASEREKPRGLTVVFPGTQEAFLSPLPVRAMSGIGRVAEQRLLTLGITTLGQLATCPDDLARKALGSNATTMVMRARGQEHSCVAEACAEDEVKSVSNERTFVEDLTSTEDVEAAVSALSAMVGRRLRAKGLTGTCVHLKLRHDFTSTRTAQRQLTLPTDDEHVFGKVALELLREVWREGTGVRLLGIGMTGFDHADTPIQLGLFDDPPADRDLRALSVTTDAVRKRFGDDAVSYGSELRLKGTTTKTVPQHHDGE